jgi:hypothetical protein
VRKLSAAAAALFISVAIGAPGSAGAQQTEITWVQTLPETGASGCVEYVAQWSDGSLTSVPYECPPGSVVVRPGSSATADKSFPQIGPSGCTEYIAQWSDGVSTWVPVSCPTGVVYPKPVEVATPTRPVTPPVLVSPPLAPPVTGGLEFVAVNGAAPGGTASVTIRTVPGSQCSILYVTPSGALRAGPGLEQAVADENGVVTWAWVIESNAQPGAGFVAVSCGQHSGRADIIIG